MKHTPGPWKIGKQYLGCRDIVAPASGDEEDIVICCTSGSPEVEDDIDRGNAHLIAASPTMYGKLKDTVVWLDREIKNRRESIERLDDEVNQFMNLDIGFQLTRLTKLRNDLAETLRKITEGE